MRVILSLLLSVVGLVSQSVLAGEPPVLLVLGDSLSAGYGMHSDRTWVHLLELRLQDNGSAYRVLNSSISGDTTQGGLARLPRLLERYQPIIVIIELGANDGLRGINPGITRENMSKMIRASQDSGAQVLLTGIRLPPNYGAAYLKQFESIYTDLARDYATLLVPFFMEGIVFEPGLLQADGIHPNEKGQLLLLENVWQVLKPALLSTDQEIGHLLDFVAQTPCQYDRNGTIHTGQEARDHINRKYQYFKKKIKTTEDFIKYSATQSTISGKKYKIHCPDTGTMDASDWLLQELDRFRRSPEA